MLLFHSLWQARILYLYTVDLGLVYVAAGGLALQVWPDVARPVDPTVRPEKRECRHCFDWTICRLFVGFKRPDVARPVDPTVRPEKSEMSSLL